MKKITEHRFDVVYRILLFLTCLTGATTWLPFLRCLFDGKTYQWSTSFLGYTLTSAGINLPYLYILFWTGIWLFLMYSFFWIRNVRIFQFLLIVWFGSMLTNMSYDIFRGESFMFHGDTMGVHLDLTPFIMTFMVVVILLVAIVLMGRKADMILGFWSKRNTRWLIALSIWIPLQAIFFATGEPHGSTDEIGVVISLLQVILVYFGMTAYGTNPGISSKGSTLSANIS